MRRVKNLAIAAFLSFVCFTGGIFLLEGVLRLKNRSMNNYDIEMWRYAKELKVQHASLGHDHATSRSVVLQNVPVRLNSWGVRGAEFGPRKANERRILFLGSSITFGWGVPEEKTLTGLLEEQLRSTGQPVTVINGGIGNYNSERYVERFFLNLKDTDPTDIVVQYFLRDAEELEKGRNSWLLRNSELAVTLWTVIQRLLHPPGKGTLVDHYRHVYAQDAPGFQKMKSALARLHSHCQSRKIRLYLAMTPDVHDLSQYPFEEIHRQMETTAKNLGYQYVDLLPALRGLTPKEIFALPGDPHPNALGHERMASALFPVLSR